MNSYSIAIIPPTNIIKKIGLFKENLAFEIGYYSSKNSEAHISLTSFETDLNGEQIIKIFLRDFASRQFSFRVKFNQINSFPHTLYIGPDENSNPLLKELMKSFHRSSPKFPCKKFYMPHIIIGRNLDEHKIKTAFEIINSVDINFQCNNITLRKKKQEDRQFQIVEQFWFND